jgi:NhaP-type Na+/H+ or K+/H+ antiporter
MTEFVLIAFALIAGLLMTRLFKKTGLNFPDVTAFLITGLLIGPYGLGRLGIEGIGFTTMAEVARVEFISKAALGFIAFSIGNEFRLSQLQGTGKQATIVGIAQAVVAMIVVDAILLVVHFIVPDKLSIPAAITMGAIATATAPAATLMVVKQYKAHGKLTSLLLPIVALDDAVGLVLFAVSFGVAQAMISSSVSLVAILVNPLVEIAASVLLGAILGAILTKIEETFFSNSNRMSMSIAFVLLTIALSTLEFEMGPVTLRFSSLLVCMMLGTTLCNLCPRSGDIMKRSDMWTAPLYALFFIISGAELELNVFSDVTVIIIGILYIAARSAGKYFGARESSRVAGCNKNIVRYLGYTLLPQAGVALGMCQQAVTLGSRDGKLIKNIILFAVLIYELAGPSITRWALESAGEIGETPASKTSHERFNTPKDTKRI